MIKDVLVTSISQEISRALKAFVSGIGDDDQRYTSYYVTS
jgi:hypothetical protein